MTSPAKIGIQVNKRQLPDVMRDLESAYREHYKTRPVNLFDRGGVPLALARDMRTHTELLSAQRLKMEMGHWANWFMEDGRGKKVGVYPPDELIYLALDNPGLLFPNLRGIAHTPVLDYRGQWSFDRGYSPASELYTVLEPSIKFDVGRLMAPDESLERVKAPAAVSYLLDEVLEGFPFASEMDRLNALAAFILPFVMRYIDDATPIFMIEAVQNNSGKSTLAQMVGIVAQGYTVDAITPEPDMSLSEQSKMFTSCLMEHPSLVILDNLDGKIASSKLCAIVSELRHTDRLLGVNRMVHLETKCQWIITANNPNVRDDIARRSVRIKLTAQVDGRPLKRSNLRQWTLDNRGRIVDSILTILCLWTALGKPLGDVSMSSFQKYTQVMSGIFHAAGIEGFMAGYRDAQRSYDPFEQDVQSFVAHWHKTFGTNEQTPTALMGLCVKNGIFADRLTGATDYNRISQMTHLLRKVVGRVVGRFTIEKAINSRTKNYLYRLFDPAAVLSIPTNLVELAQLDPWKTPAVPEQDTEQSEKADE